MCLPILKRRARVENMRYIVQELDQNREIVHEFRSKGAVYVGSSGVIFIEESTGNTIQFGGNFKIIKVKSP